MQDVAERAGVSKATVSRFLQNHPNLKPGMRERVGEAIRELGYRSDPMLSGFLRQVRAGHVLGSGTVLGWINTRPEEGYWSQKLNHPLFRGAKAHCEEQGLKLETFWAGDPDLSPKRLQSILQSRNIRGLILPPGSSANKRMPGFDWSMFAVVEVNPSPSQTNAWSHVGTDAHGNMRILLEKLRGLGYRSIGLVLPQAFSSHHGHGMLAEALLQRFLDADSSICRPWLYQDEFLSSGNQAGFLDWIHKESPDVLICLDARMKKILAANKLSVPDEIGLAHVNLAPDVQGWSGLNLHSDNKGRAAVDLLLAQLSRNELGNPSEKRQLMIPGEWVQGRSTRPRD